MSDPEDSKIPTWVNFIVRVGVPAAIALFLVYWLTMRLDNKIEDLDGNIRAQRQLQQSVHEELKVHMMNSIVAINLARRLCVNTAKTDDQVRECWAQ